MLDELCCYHGHGHAKGVSGFLRDKEVLFSCFWGS